jgi:putative nucleotidyltransferase with HDIG domain
MKQCQQNGYHHKDVWEHSLLVMEHTEEITCNPDSYFGGCGSEIENVLDAGKIPLLKLTALLHDVGKPSTAGTNPETGRITFYGHDREGAALTDSIAGRLRMSNEAREFISGIVAEHLHPLMLSSPKTKATAKMRWFRRMRDDAVPALILSMADVMSSLGPDSGESYRQNYITWTVESVCEYFKSIKAKVESPPLINGDDLIALGLKPGPEIGKILARIRDAQDAGEVISRDEALEAAREMLSREDI